MTNPISGNPGIGRVDVNPFQNNSQGVERAESATSEVPGIGNQADDGDSVEISAAAEAAYAFNEDPELKPRIPGVP